MNRFVAPNRILLVALFALGLFLTGCAKSDRMDGAVDAGVAASKKAAEYKKGAQGRVDSATAVLDGK